MNRKETQINIFGINTNNLKNIDVSIPLEGITLIVGPSGSGKSSLAYDTLRYLYKLRERNVTLVVADHTDGIDDCFDCVEQLSIKNNTIIVLLFL